MVPPGKMAGFDMVFCAKQVMEVRKVVEYCINEQHRLNFTVVADVSQDNDESESLTLVC